MAFYRQGIIDIIQWILIILLSLILLISYVRLNKTLSADTEYRKDNTYTKIYESQKIEKLKNENRILYDSIKNLKNVESVVEIQYKYRYKTDTVYVNKIIKEIIENKDSVYDIHYNNDTIDYNLKISANDVRWYIFDFKINDKFTLINQNKDNLNETTIIHNPNVEIKETTMYHVTNKENKWYKRFGIGPQIGLGVNNHGEFSPYFGVGITYNLLKK